MILKPALMVELSLGVIVFHSCLRWRSYRALVLCCFFHDAQHGFLGLHLTLSHWFAVFIVEYLPRLLLDILGGALPVEEGEVLRLESLLLHLDFLWVFLQQKLFGSTDDHFNYAELVHRIEQLLDVLSHCPHGRVLMQKEHVRDYKLLLGLYDDLHLLNSSEPGKVVLYEVFAVREEARYLKHEDFPLLLGKLKLLVIVVLLANSRLAVENPSKDLMLLLGNLMHLGLR